MLFYIFRNSDFNKVPNRDPQAVVRGKWRTVLEQQ